MTEWRPVLGYEGLYEVSSMGDVRSIDRTVMRAASPMKISGRIIAPQIAKTGGYIQVRISKNGKSKLRFVANLVCEAFHGPRPKGKFAAHGNGAKADNRQSNISWKTRKENEADKILHGTKPVGETVGGALLNGSQVVAIRSLRAAGNTYNQIATELGVTFGCVRGVCARGAYSNVREAA